MKEEGKPAGLPLRLLIAEDSEDDCELIVRELRRGGYDVKFERIDTAADLEKAFNSHEWDLIISDFSMPILSGTDALTLVRQKRPDIPFIFVSGTMGEETAVAAMKNGAQDYLMKGSLKRLVPAVQRELRDAEERRTRKRLEAHVHQLQKFEAIGRLAGGIAHDFNNMIGAILGWAEMGLDEAPPGTRLRERFEKIRQQSGRAAKLTSQLLAFGRRQLLQPRSIDLNALVQEEMSFLGKVIGADIEINVLAARGLWATFADPTQLEQVLMNLCLNARDAMAEGGRLVIETRNVEIGEEYCHAHAYAKPGSYVLLSVSDTGSGMDAATMERLFEPFFTTKELGRGTGLGLATVYGIVKQHNGFIHVYSEPGKGTSFRVYLVADAGAGARPEVKHSDQIVRGTGTILIADDHEGLRDSVQAMLQALGYQTIVARDGLEALRLFETNKDLIDLLLLDVTMPGLNGPEVYSKIIASRPDTKVIFSSGYTSGAASLIEHTKKGAQILQKPYSLAVLGQAIRKALESRDLKLSYTGNESSV